MKRHSVLVGLLASAAFFSIPAKAVQTSFGLTLKETEKRVIESSNQLKSLSAISDAANEQAGSQFSALLPTLTLNASYTYIANVPTLDTPLGTFAFGSHNNYSVGPALNYTLWDTGGARDSYHGLQSLAQSREEDRKGSEIQILLLSRSAYLKLQLALEELRLLGNSLELSRAQNRDIEANFRAGAATQLDRVDSQRDVISYELQFEQKQVEVGSDLKDLLALIQSPPPASFAHPGPPGVAGVELELTLDTLAQSLSEAATWRVNPPDQNLPAIRSQALLAESSTRAADGLKSTLYPTLKLSASAVVEYPNQVIPENTTQAIVGVSLSMPLFEGDRTRHQMAEKRREADAAVFTQEQTRINAERDYGKALEQVDGLRSQQKLASLDVQRSAEAARLYYRSYKGGKNNLIDVQSANNRALVSQVNAARIDAQILNQLFVLKSLSGEAKQNGR